MKTNKIPIQKIHGEPLQSSQEPMHVAFESEKHDVLITEHGDNLLLPFDKQDEPRAKVEPFKKKKKKKKKNAP